MQGPPRYNASFPSRLSRFAFATLERSQDIIFGVSRDLRLIYFNPAYLAFAQRNGGDEALVLDRDMLGAISGDARPFYERHLRATLETGRPWSHEYLCPSADRYREFHQIVFPLVGLGLALINSVKVDAPLTDYGFQPSPLLDADYVQANGSFTQCSNCRRTLRADGSGVWDWVPSLVRASPKTSYSICPPCFDLSWKSPSP